MKYYVCVPVIVSVYDIVEANDEDEAAFIVTNDIENGKHDMGDYEFEQVDDIVVERR